ncbi:hypothetical protein [Motiliproteus sp. SC1-56]|uniref:hypothetical protein n=1 Tax=Motiliproteus sp. SC1-56 TaxID=2799565 RepID=UPI001A8EE74B|nr:hypothetical protein [Motiliproteus sp. SC1-56]
MPNQLCCCLGALLLSGCSLSHWGLAPQPPALTNREPSSSLQVLNEAEPASEDRLLHGLQRALFEHLNGHFAASNLLLHGITPQLSELKATSITETLGAGALNETLRAYLPTPSEQALLHQLAMLNYLLLGEPARARVEALQADLLFRRLASAGGLNGQLASTRFVAGLVFEILGEWDNALIAYRDASELLEARDETPPAGLTLSLERMRQQLGLTSPAPSSPAQPAGQELVVLLWQGQISPRVPQQLRLYNPALRQHLAFALPIYAASYPPPREEPITLGDGLWHAMPLENLEQRVREDLARQRPALIAAATSRAFAKFHISREAGATDEILGVLVDLALTLGEVADLRSWSSLPSHILLARIPLPAAPVNLEVEIGGRSTAAPRHRIGLLLLHTASGRLFRYPAIKEPADA